MWTAVDCQQCPMPECLSTKVEYRVVADEEGNEDEQYHCIDCDYTWWIDA